jgi:hypothetical protein
MASSVTPRAAVKRAAPRKAVAEKNVAAAKSADKKAAAPRKRRVLPKRTAIPAIRPEERRRLIEAAAYFMAERRGFQGASPVDDWLQAEREIDALIAAGKFAA